MPAAFPVPRSASRVSQAFSLVEVLIAVALLSVIVLGLMAMFGQTQRAFRVGLAQTDVLESGRAATELLARELQQVTPSGLPGTTNFSAEMVSYWNSTPPNDRPLLQYLPGRYPPGTVLNRTNFFETLYFLTCENKRWTANGFFVFPTNSGVGTLYNFIGYAPPRPTSADFANLYRWFAAAKVDPERGVAKRVAEGVVHFRVRAFDTNGVWITSPLKGARIFARSSSDWQAPRDPVPGEVLSYEFTSNAVPAAVEIELGFLEARTLERANSIADAATRRNYLSNHVGQVHLFRQRIPIEAVDVKAYQ